MYAGYINIFYLGKLSKSLKNKNLDQPLALMFECTISIIIVAIWKMEVGGHRQIGRPKLRWGDDTVVPPL